MDSLLCGQYMLNVYEYYIECFVRTKDHTTTNFKWCKRYYDEVYKDIEKISMTKS